MERHERQERIARWLGLDVAVGAVALWVRARVALAHRRAARLARGAQAGQAVAPNVAVPLPAMDSEPERPEAKKVGDEPGTVRR